MVCSQCDQQYHGVVACALGWACWKRYVGRPEKDNLRGMAMGLLGAGLYQAGHHEEALPVQEALLSMFRRLGAPTDSILAQQHNLALTYGALGRHEQAQNMYRDVYSGYLRLYGEENSETLLVANNYSVALVDLRRFEEAKALLRKTMPVAQLVFGESNAFTLKMRKNYADALYENAGATLDDLREAVTTLEEIERTALQVFGGAHPTTVNIGRGLRNARAALATREAGEN